MELAPFKFEIMDLPEFCEERAESNVAVDVDSVRARETGKDEFGMTAEVVEPLLAAVSKLSSQIARELCVPPEVGRKVGEPKGAYAVVDSAALNDDRWESRDVKPLTCDDARRGDEEWERARSDDSTDVEMVPETLVPANLFLVSTCARPAGLDNAHTC